jgi:uncharacterized protein
MVGAVADPLNGNSDCACVVGRESWLEARRASVDRGNRATEDRSDSELNGVGRVLKRAFCGAGFACVLMTALFATACFAATGNAGSKIRIAFAGDSIVDNYWSGITRVIDADSCLKGTVELGRFAHNGTGLTRGDRIYWPREIRRINDVFKPTVLVLSIGLNDRQFIVDGTGARTAWGAPNWTDKYKQEIVEFLKGATASKAPVLLIGLPVMRDSVDNNDVIEKNAMYLEAVEKLGIPNLHFIEPWKLKATSPDVFASYGPDKNGKLVQIRTSDGQHFTVAGEDLVAPYLFPSIIAALKEAGITPDQCADRQSKNKP